MKYLGYGGTSTIFKGALFLCYRLKTNKLQSDIHVNMPQKRKFSLSLGRKHNRTIKRSAQYDLKANCSNSLSNCMPFVIRLCAKGFVFYAQDQIIGDR